MIIKNHTNRDMIYFVGDKKEIERFEKEHVSFKGISGFLKSGESHDLTKQLKRRKKEDSFIKTYDVVRICDFK